MTIKPTLDRLSFKKKPSKYMEIEFNMPLSVFNEIKKEMKKLGIQFENVENPKKRPDKRYFYDPARRVKSTKGKKGEDECRNLSLALKQKSAR